MNSSAITSDEPFCALATYLGSYFSGRTFTSHTLKAAQRAYSLASRILLPLLKSTSAYRLSCFQSVKVFATAPVAFGVIVPRNTTGAAAHGCGAAPGPPSHMRSCALPVASSVALVTRFAQ